MIICGNCGKDSRVVGTGSTCAGSARCGGSSSSRRGRLRLEMVTGRHVLWDGAKVSAGTGGIPGRGEHLQVAPEHAPGSAAARTRREEERREMR